MKHILIRQSLKEGWRLFMLRPWYLLGLTSAVAGLFAVTSTDAIATALAYIVYGGYIALLLKHARGETVVFDDLFTIDQGRWISFAFMSAIKALLIVLGLLFFIVPGVYLMVRWMFAEILVIEKGMRPLEALRASSKLTEGCRGKLFVYTLTTVLVVLLGILCFGVGLFAAVTIVWFATISIYKNLQKNEGEAIST